MTMRRGSPLRFLLGPQGFQRLVMYQSRAFERSLGNSWWGRAEFIIKKPIANGMLGSVEASKFQADVGANKTGRLVFF